MIRQIWPINDDLPDFAYQSKDAVDIPDDVVGPLYAPYREYDEDWPYTDEDEDDGPEFPTYYDAQGNEHGEF